MDNKQITGPGYTCLIQSKAQAEMVLYQVFKTYTLEQLHYQALYWLGFMPANVIQEYEHLSTTLEQSESWLLGDEASPFTEEKDLAIQKAVLILVLIQFATHSWQLFGRDIHAGKSVTWEFGGLRSFQILDSLIKSITLSHIMNLLQQALETVTGKEYLLRFREEMKKAAPVTDAEHNQVPEEAPPGEHRNLMLISDNFCCLVEACYALLKHP